MQELPSPQEALEVLSHSLCDDAEMDFMTWQADITEKDLQWALHLGRFKTALRMVK